MKVKKVQTVHYSGELQLWNIYKKIFCFIFFVFSLQVKKVGILFCTEIHILQGWMPLLLVGKSKNLTNVTDKE